MTWTQREGTENQRPTTLPSGIDEIPRSQRTSAPNDRVSQSQHTHTPGIDETTRSQRTSAPNDRVSQSQQEKSLPSEGAASNRNIEDQRLINDQAYESRTRRLNEEIQMYREEALRLSMEEERDKLDDIKRKHEKEKKNK